MSNGQCNRETKMATEPSYVASGDTKTSETIKDIRGAAELRLTVSVEQLRHGNKSAAN